MKQRLMCILCLLYALSALGALFSGCVNKNFEQEYYSHQNQQRELEAQEQAEYMLWEQQVKQEEQQAQQERFGESDAF